MYSGVPHSVHVLRVRGRRRSWIEKEIKETKRKSGEKRREKERECKRDVKEREIESVYDVWTAFAKPKSMSLM